MRASKAAKEFMHWSSILRREEQPLKDLWVSTKCGESDTTSGCTLLAEADAVRLDEMLQDPEVRIPGYRRDRLAERALADGIEVGAPLLLEQLRPTASKAEDVA